MPTLTPKQQRFVEEYAADLNATRAAIRAGYSAHTAAQQGARLLRNVQVAAAVDAGRLRLADAAGRAVAAVMADIGRVRDNAMEMVTDPDTGTQTMRSHKDALRALELEGKHLGAFDERVRLMGPDGAALAPVTRVELVAVRADSQTAQDGRALQTG